MSKTVFIAEKPSVAREFANALHVKFQSRDGFMESENVIVTWCVGHLVTMCYPDAYDPKYKKWSLSTIPFIPSEYRYQVIDSVKKQYRIVAGILTSPDVDTIYICTDSGREGEYIYRLVASQAGVKNKRQLRVWIDSQTQEEILRGIKEAKGDSEYDNLGDAAYLRAQEDYLMGINFSRALTLKYGDRISSVLGTKYSVIAVGRVMTCVLGMVVSREREIRSFVKTPFYRIVGNFRRKDRGGGSENDPSGSAFQAEWRAEEGSIVYASPKLYKENGFKKREDAEEMIRYLEQQYKESGAVIESVTRKKETKRAPLLYNLAELQNDGSKYFHISPDQTLAAAQELYEKKLTTYPRTDARVLSSAVAKEIDRNLKGIGQIPMLAPYAEHILKEGLWKKIGKTRYTNDKAITDHYAIIPTGQGLRAIQGLSPTTRKIYELICRRFLSVFYPPAVYDKISLRIRVGTEIFTASERALREKGYLEVTEGTSFLTRKEAVPSGVSGGASKRNSGDTSTGDSRNIPSKLTPGRTTSGRTSETGSSEPDTFRLETSRQGTSGPGISEPGTSGDGTSAPETSSEIPAETSALSSIRKNTPLVCDSFEIKEGETKPPKRYNSGSIILAMENAGQLIEEEELREQIRGSGIGTSATRAEILKKLVTNKYLALNRRTQIITPTFLGEMIYDTVYCSIRPLLDPKLTASWEKGLSQVAEGKVSRDEYTEKLNGFVIRRTEYVKSTDFSGPLMEQFRRCEKFYPEKKAGRSIGKARSSGKTGRRRKAE